MAVGADFVGGDAAAAEVGDERHAAFGVEGYVARPAAHGGDLVEQAQLAAGLDAVGTHGARVLPIPHRDLVDGVNEAVIGMDRQEGRIRGGDGEFRCRNGACLGVEVRQEDAFAGAAGVSADIEGILGGGLVRGPRGNLEQRRGGAGNEELATCERHGDNYPSLKRGYARGARTCRGGAASGRGPALKSPFADHKNTTETVLIVWKWVAMPPI